MDYDVYDFEYYAYLMLDRQMRPYLTVYGFGLVRDKRAIFLGEFASEEAAQDACSEAWWRYAIHAADGTPDWHDFG